MPKPSLNDLRHLIHIGIGGKANPAISIVSTDRSTTDGLAVMIVVLADGSQKRVAHYPAGGSGDEVWDDGWMEVVEDDANANASEIERLVVHLLRETPHTPSELAEAKKYASQDHDPISFAKCVRRVRLARLGCELAEALARHREGRASACRVGPIRVVHGLLEAATYFIKAAKDVECDYAIGLADVVSKSPGLWPG